MTDGKVCVLLARKDAHGSKLMAFREGLNVLYFMFTGPTDVSQIANRMVYHCSFLV